MSNAPTVRRVLAQAGLAPLDAQVLLAYVLGRDRGWLHAHAPEALAAADAEAFFRLARRRRDGEPVAYLTGRREFFGLSLAITPSVLVPRPETETLVECALARMAAGLPLRILDLGTGSGAIALALAHERPQASVLATDRSEAALALACDNVQRLALSNVQCVRADWFDGLPDGGRFDLIASNPPYVALGDPHLAEGDLRFEPPGALAAGADGLDALRTIVAGAPARLAAGGWLVVEHGYEQADAVRRLFEDAGFTAFASQRDLSGIPRVAAGRVP